MRPAKIMKYEPHKGNSPNTLSIKVDKTIYTLWC